MSRVLTKKELEKCLWSINCIIQEWLGNDIPSEGTEDYERWQMMTLDRDDIKTIEDFKYWLEIHTSYDVEDYIFQLEQ